MERLQTGVAVIGAGVIGLAVAAVLAAGGHEVVILEAEASFGTVTSSRNSEVLHAGLYYPAGSWKARFCADGNRQIRQWCEAHGVPLQPVGKLVVATGEDELPRLVQVQQTAAASGVELEWLTAGQVRQMEPALACAGALVSRQTAIIDSHRYMLSLLGEAESHGAMLARQTPVLGGEALDDGSLLLSCGGDSPFLLHSPVVINAAGLSAQAVSRRLNGIRRDSIPPLSLARGNYFSLAGKAPFSRLVYPLPVAGGLGVHYTVDLGGAGRFGPDVEWLPADDPALEDPSQLDYRVDPRRGEAFYAAIRRYWPALPDGALQPAYSGVRPKPYRQGETPQEDFVLHGPETTGVDGLFTLYGIESPGLTSSLSLANYLASLLAGRSPG